MGKTARPKGHRTSKAVEWLRMNYAKSLRIEELAAMARMGVSTLHHQFGSLTAMSPLQYPKQLRLHRARERMPHDGRDASRAASSAGLPYAMSTPGSPSAQRRPAIDFLDRSW